MKVLLILIVTISLSSCSWFTEVRYIPFSAPVPPPIPDLMRITDAELGCLSQSSYDKIVILDKRRQTLRRILETIKRPQNQD